MGTPDFRSEDPQADWVALASPAAGRSFLPYIESPAAEVRRTIERTAAAIDAVQLETLYAPRVGGLGFTPTDRPERLARAVVASWLTGIAVGAFTTNASLVEAERWFLGTLLDELPAVAPPVPAPTVSMTADEAFALLPYILDRHRQGTRRELLRNVDSRADRRRRKENGVYYTPGDVAQAMVGLVGAKIMGSILDPACGTGVFLRAAIDRGSSPYCVYGIDIDEHAIEVATFVVLAATIRRSGELQSPWAMWHRLRPNFACMNSLVLERGGCDAERVDEVEKVKQLLAEAVLVGPAKSHSVVPKLGVTFPRLVDGANVVLSNPPYAPLGPSASLVPPGGFVAYGRRADSTARAEAAFVEFLWKLTAADGAGSLVLPLSVASSSRPEFARVRERMEDTPGSWSFGFFDRAPDALFGDDVKTRNVILVYEAAVDGGTTIRTTPLLRWTSRNRAAFLRGLSFTEIEPKIARLVPKVGARSEAILYSALRGLEGFLSDSVITSRVVLPQRAENRNARCAVFVAPTAYNWIGLARETAAFTRHGHTSTSGMLELIFPNEVKADAAFALLSSKFVLWLWRVESDGFHVTNTFVLNTPFSINQLSCSAVERLSSLGAALWDEALGNPTISVNRGRTTVGYATNSLSLSASVDEAVVQAFGLPPSVNDAVRAWHQNLLVVDFSESRRVAAACARGIGA